MARAPKGYRQARTAVDPKAKVQLTGPLFQPDADATLRQNIRRMLAGMAEEGEGAVRARSPRHTGAFAMGVQGRTVSKSGRKWAVTAVVSQTHVYPWKNKGARGFVGRAQAEYRGGKVEARYRMFRSVTYQLRQARAVATADIVKGLT